METPPPESNPFEFISYKEAKEPRKVTPGERKRKVAAFFLAFIGLVMLPFGIFGALFGLGLFSLAFSLWDNIWAKDKSPKREADAPGAEDSDTSNRPTRYRRGTGGSSVSERQFLNFLFHPKPALIVFGGLMVVGVAFAVANQIYFRIFGKPQVAQNADTKPQAQIPFDDRVYLQLRKAHGHIEKQEFDDALRCFDEAIRINPNDANTFFAYFNKGRIHIDRMEYPEAIKDYTECLRFQSINRQDSIVIFANRGYAYVQVRSYERAIDDLTECLRFNPEDEMAAATHCNRGVAYRAIKKYKEAIDDCSEAMRLMPVAYANLKADIEDMETKIK